MAEEGHCFKCKATRKMVTPQTMTASNGRTMLQGKCEKCGTIISKIVSKIVKNAKK